NSALPLDNLIDPACGHANILSQAVLTNVHGFQKFFEEDFSWMNRVESVFCHGSVLVIINDLHVIDVAIAPFKTNAPLVVNANTVLALAVAGQFFKMVGWWYTQILQRVCAIKELQLPPRSTLNVLRQL